MKALLVGFLCLGMVFPGFGCSCFYEAMSVKKLISYDLVFLGEVVKQDPDNTMQGQGTDGIPEPFLMENVAYTFKVKDFIKGKLSKKEVTIYTASSGAACGTSFNMGETYYVYAGFYKNQYHTGLCANNQRQSSVNKAYKKIVCQYKKKKRKRDWGNVDGQLTATGEIKKLAGERLAAGEWTFYYKDGTIESSGTFVKGERHGTWNYYLDRESSKVMIDELTEEQRARIERADNVLTRREVFVDGERKETVNVFE